jgi:hypothetical protein
MALVDFADYLARTGAPQEQIRYMLNSFVHPTTCRYVSYYGSSGTRAFDASGNVNSVVTLPGAAAICTRTTVGAAGQTNVAGGSPLKKYMWLDNIIASVTGPGTLIVADRLAHMSGLSGTNVAAQAVAFPALTRYTTGEKVIAAVEIYGAVGATPTTITASYTNQAGVAGRTSQPIDIGNTGLNNPGRILPFNLQAGDSGVQQVASVTLAATTGTAGNFGVTLFRPLLAIPVAFAGDYGASGDPLREIGLHMPQIENDACLQFMFYAQGQFTQSIALEMKFMEV